jgi:Cupredoxin-like domain
VVKRGLVLAAVLAAVATAVAPVGMATTAPGYNFKIKLTIKTGGQLQWSSNQVKRGWLARFTVTNRDKKAHTFNVGGLGPKRAIAPGKTAKVGAYCENRGQFAFKVDGKTRGYLVVN